MPSAKTNRSGCDGNSIGNKTSGLKSPVAYMGGKARMAPRIIDLLPVDRDCYIEVFGGAGHVLTQKAPEANEVYNDIQGVVVNFFLVLREHTDELVRRVERMPFSREEHQRITVWWNAGCPGPVTDIERAVRWYYLLKTSFSSIHGKKFGYGRGTNVGMRPGAFVRSADRLQMLAQRWRMVHLESLDFADLIPRYDTAGTVFYCDPPYVGCEHYYGKSGFGPDDHRRLAAVLAGVKGRVILSYYEHKTVDRLYPRSGWWRRRYQVTKSSKVVSRGESLPRATELLLLNFDPRTGRRLKDERAKKKRNSQRR